MTTDTAPVEAPEKPDLDEGDGLTHTYCCAPPITALCGADIRESIDVDYDTATNDLCVVCEDLIPANRAAGGCEKCR